MSLAGENFEKVAREVSEALRIQGRGQKLLQNLGMPEPNELKILPVSKGHSIEKLKVEMQDARLPRDFSENYEQELLEKSAALEGVRWHFLGALQSRKIPKLCEVVFCLHTVSRSQELKLISEQKRVPYFFLQVNISDESQKNGCRPESLQDLLGELESLGLAEKFLGLMGMSSPLDEVGEEKVRAQFASLRKLRDELCPRKLLNMGMSDDFKIAISEGSNLLRIGTAIFGKR